VDELIGHGVGRAVARRLAGKKPEVCRRCLDYLPYADYRTTPGAWLAHAIRDEYGPPRAYLAAREAEAEQARIAATVSERSRRESALRRRVEESRERTREAHTRMEAEDGEALASFRAFLDRERAAAVKIAANLSQARQHEYLEAQNNSERRLELFEQWLRTSEAAPAMQASAGHILGGTVGR